MMYEFESIDLENLDMSHVTNAILMFYGCTRLREIDLSWKNISRVTNMDSIFKWCTWLQNVNMSNRCKLNNFQI